jgi:hypothetical protein
MKKENEIKIFEGKKVRTLWDDEQEKWFISIVDAIEVLTGSPNPRKYWSVLKLRLKKEGSQLATNCSQLKMQSANGKLYKAITQIKKIIVQTISLHIFSFLKNVENHVFSKRFLA